MNAEIETRSLNPWPMVVAGSEARGFALHWRAKMGRTVPLTGSTLREAVSDAIMKGIGAEGGPESLFIARHEPVAAPKAGNVYFIAGDVGAVKIGFAVNPELRLSSLQCGSPIKLQILATVAGMPSLEREYHRRFAAFRLHGEWFHRHPTLLAEIRRLNRLSLRPLSISRGE